MDLTGRRAIIFDFDGTIADTKPGILRTAATVLADWDVSDEALAHIGDIIGPPFPQAFEQVFGLSHEDAVEVTRRYRAIYPHLGIEAWPAFPGMVQLLEDLRAQDRLLAVASSKLATLVHAGLADNGLLDTFVAVCAKQSDDDTTKVDAIRKALEKLGVGPGEALMVGDRHHDVEAAAVCGVPCVGVLYGDTGTRSELVDAGAIAVAATVGELRALLVDATV